MAGNEQIGGRDDASEESGKLDHLHREALLAAP
jgi:hypothetical protein